MASFKNFSRDLSKHSVSHLSHIISHLSPPSYVAITGILVTLLCLFFTFSGRAPSTIPPLIFNPQVVISFYNPPLIPSVSISVPPSPLQVDLVDEEEEENGGFRTCDLFDGRWVFDDDLPSYPPSSCPFIDSAFDCHKNGRKDLNYTKLRWQPKDCTMHLLAIH